MSENEAIERMLTSAATYCSYGHFISQLQRAWQKLLQDGGLDEKAARLGSLQVMPLYDKIDSLEAELKAVRKSKEKDWKHVLDTFQKMTDDAGLNINPAECAWEEYVGHPLELLEESEEENVRLNAELVPLRDFCEGVPIDGKGGLKELVEAAKAFTNALHDVDKFVKLKEALRSIAGEEDGE